MRKTLLTLALGLSATAQALGADCETREYVVGIDSARPDNPNGWAIWLSPKPYFDSEAARYPSDMGGRLNLYKDRGQFTMAMAMNAMNMGYATSLSDVYGPQFCDDFQDLKLLEQE